MDISVVTTVGLKLHCEVELTTLSEEELNKLLQALEAASKTIREEKARRWVAAGKPKSASGIMLDKLFSQLDSKL